MSRYTLGVLVIWGVTALGCDDRPIVSNLTSSNDSSATGSTSTSSDAAVQSEFRPLEITLQGEPILTLTPNSTGDQWSTLEINLASMSLTLGEDEPLAVEAFLAWFLPRGLTQTLSELSSCLPQPGNKLSSWCPEPDTIDMYPIFNQIIECRNFLKDKGNVKWSWTFFRDKDGHGGIALNLPNDDRAMVINSWGEKLARDVLIATSSAVGKQASIYFQSDIFPEATKANGLALIALGSEGAAWKHGESYRLVVATSKDAQQRIHQNIKLTDLGLDMQEPYLRGDLSFAREYPREWIGLGVLPPQEWSRRLAVDPEFVIDLWSRRTQEGAGR